MLSESAVVEEVNSVSQMPQVFFMFLNFLKLGPRHLIFTRLWNPHLSSVKDGTQCVGARPFLLDSCFV